MSKTNYNKMYENDNERTVKDVTSIETGNTIENTEVTTLAMDETVTEFVEPEAIVAEQPQQSKHITATVCNCAKLNVRESANPVAKVLTIINVNDEVTIDEDQSNGNFYSVTTATGIKGYCIKDYLKVK